MKILITGGCGFVGSNIAIFLKKNLRKADIFSVDNLFREGSKINKNRLKNLLLAGSLVGLTACGGGGGGAGGAISNFVEEDLSSLTGSETIINSYSSLLSGFNSTISSGNFASLSAIMTGPKDEDISKANDLLSMSNHGCSKLH